MFSEQINQCCGWLDEWTSITWLSAAQLRGTFDHAKLNISTWSCIWMVWGQIFDTYSYIWIVWGCIFNTWSCMWIVWGLKSSTWFICEAQYWYRRHVTAAGTWFVQGVQEAQGRCRRSIIYAGDTVLMQEACDWCRSNIIYAGGTVLMQEA